VHVQAKSCSAGSSSLPGIDAQKVHTHSGTSSTAASKTLKPQALQQSFQFKAVQGELNCTKASSIGGDAAISFGEGFAVSQ
jgi:hypothetical protein